MHFKYFNWVALLFLHLQYAYHMYYIRCKYHKTIVICIHTYYIYIYVERERERDV